jgi:hypothetical protein
MTQAAMNWDCLPIGKIARAWLKMIDAKAEPHVASVDPGGEAFDLSKLPLDYYAPGAQYFYGRSAWGGNATTFHWQLGDYFLQGVGHSQYDYGNFQIWRGGRWLTRESVGYSDTFTGLGGKGKVGSDKTEAHNSLLVNGIGLSEPSDVGTEGPAVVRRVESQPEYAYADADLTKTYRNRDPGHPERDNPAVDHVEREIVFIRSLETTVIFDRIKSNAVKSKNAEAITKTFLTHFEANPTVEDPNHVTYTSGDQALRLSVLVPATAQTVVVDEKSAEDDKMGQFRVEVTTSGEAQSYFLTVLQAKGASAPALQPSVADTGSTYAVTLDPSTSLVFEKGVTSSGGSVTVAGTTKNLRSDVQTVTVTDSGPYWQ